MQRVDRSLSPLRPNLDRSIGQVARRSADAQTLRFVARALTKEYALDFSCHQKMADDFIHRASASVRWRRLALGMLGVGERRSCVMLGLQRSETGPRILLRLQVRLRADDGGLRRVVFR